MIIETVSRLRIYITPKMWSVDIFSIQIWMRIDTKLLLHSESDLRKLKIPKLFVDLEEISTEMKIILLGKLKRRIG